MISLGDLNSISALGTEQWGEKGLVEQTVGTVGAALVDVGVTMWNSVANLATFGNYDDVSTRSVLQSMGADGAVSAYDNNRDTIDLISFVGGVFIPGGAALKLSRAVRSGMKGTSFLSPVRHKDDLLKFEGLIKDAKTGTAEYRRVKRDMFLRGQAENMIDTVAAEVAIMGAFNAHPFMEDYFEDPVKNIGISLAIGGVAGGAITGLLSRSEMTNVAGKVQSAGAGVVFDAARQYATPFSDTASSLTQLELAAKNLDNIAAKDTISPLAKEMAVSMAGTMRATMGRIREATVSDDILKGVTSQEQRDQIISLMHDVRFLGAEKMSFYTPTISSATKANLQAPKLNPLQRLNNAIFRKEEIDLATGDSAQVFIKDNFFSQELGAFIDKASADLVATAADISSPQGIAQRARKFSLKQVQSDFKEKLQFASGGEVEADYLARIQFYSSKSTDDLVRTELLADDLPAINGWISAVEARKAKLNEVVSASDDPKVVSSAIDELTKLETAQVKVFEGDRVQLVNLEEVAKVPEFSIDPLDSIKPTLLDDLETEISRGSIRPLLNDSVAFSDADEHSNKFYEYVAKSMGKDKFLAKDFYRIPMEKLEQLAAEYANRPQIRDELLKMVPEDAGLSPESVLMLLRWVGGQHGDKEIFRNAMASARTLRAGMDSITPFHKELTEIINSPVIKQQREILSRHADGRGNVYMLRGTRTSPAGDTTVSSYTHNNNIAAQFGKNGTVGTYKIHTDDIVGYLYNHEREWLVGASTRDFVKGTDVMAAAAKGRPNTLSTGPAAPKFTTHSPTSLKDQLHIAKLQGIGDAMRAGQPKELIALKYNVSHEALDILGSGSPDNLVDKYRLLKTQYKDEFNSKFDRWNSVEQMGEAFAPTRRTLKVTADQSKIMGYSGELLDKQREAILGATALTSLEKQLLNSGSGEGQQLIAAKVAMIDKQYNDINTLWIEDAVMTSRSKLAGQLYNRIVARDEINILREGMKEFVNGKGGNPLYSSADFVTSRMGQVGRLVTTLGDERVHSVNKLFEEMMTPVSTHLKQIQANDVMRTEFAIFDNLRQSTKGLLRFDPEQRTFVTTPEGAVWDRKLGGFVKQEVDEAGNVINVPVAGTPAFEGKVIQNAPVALAFKELQAAGDEIWEMQATLNKVKGVQTPADIGFWIPSTNLVNSNRAFILNRDTSSIKLIVGKDKKDLESLLANYKLADNESLLTPSMVDDMKLSVHGDLLDDVGRADVAQLKQGIGLASPDISSDRLADIINGFKDRMNYQATSFMENALYDVTTKLDQLSAYNTRLTAKQSKQGFMSAVKQMQTKDTAKDIKAILTGNSQAGSQELMGYINKFASGALHFGISGFQKAFEAVRPTFKNQEVDYAKFNAALEAQGIEDPFKVFNEAARPLLYQRAKDSGYTVTPDRLVNGSNAIAATMALKFMELAQPLVNMMSLPILQVSTINRAFKAAQIESADQLLANSPLSIMMNGVRRVNSQLPENTKFMKYFEDEGLLVSTISEVDAVVRQARFGTGGVVGGLERALDSKFVEIMSKPSEVAEQLVRKTALMTGVELARRIYGNAATDRQITIFARDFLKQSIGNYSTSQRPMMFQGTFGAAMGLFQTYMLTYAQNMYRHLDLKDYKGLGQTMLAQGGIFGAGSLPGFQQVSLAIGENFSDENMDLIRGTYRGLPDPLANILIYGMPSNFAPALHTRGDVTPRIPTGFQTMVAPSMIGQALQSLVDVGKSIVQADASTGQAFMEALSMQSVSRPIARLSELATGYSITRSGNQIAGNEEVWSWQGIMARVFSTRTLSEAKVREAIHLDSVYKSANSDNRKAVLETLRTAIRADTVDDELLDNLAVEYLRTGSPQGFRQAVNQAFMENSNERLVDLHGRLGNSPLMLMIDDID